MSKRHIGILAILLAGAIRAVCAGAPMAADQPAPQIAVHFSPHGGCTDAVVRELDAAKESVLVQAYEFTSASIAKALMEVHNKVIVIDGRIVITGSFNFTKAAEESNAENLLIIRGADLGAKYANNRQEHLEHSVPYELKPKE
jgi:phosphatidylserine/phosphatidylglycerophosphate/cardiolipin synthase-like enzyme